MTGPVEKPRAAEKHAGGLAQLVRWLNEERPATGPDDVGFVGAPRRTTRWTYGQPPAAAARVEPERDVLGEVRIGPAPRCVVAGETIALSVGLINTRGGLYLGWPIKLEWSSSDPSIATVAEGGIVEVHAKGRVEITCRCEGKSGSVLLTVVEPAVAAMVGLPVPGRLLAASREAAERSPARAAFPAPTSATDVGRERPTGVAADVPPIVSDVAVPPDAPASGAHSQTDDGASTADVSSTPSAAPRMVPAPPAQPPQPRESLHVRTLARNRATRHVEREVKRRVEREPAPAARPELAAAALELEIPLEVLRELPPVHRRSVERGAVKHGVLASLAPSRGTRRVLFRLAVGAATGGFVAVALTQSPEDYFLVGEPSTAVAANVANVGKSRTPRPSGSRAALRRGQSTPRPASGTPIPLGDTSKGEALVRAPERVVAEAAGSTARDSLSAARGSIAAPTPGAGAQTSPAATPSAALAPSVSRVVVASSPSQLMEGESVRLSAAGVDDRGDPVAGRAVAWTSENPDVASVDENGVVTAKRAGTVTIVATSEGRTGRVTLSVGTRKAPPPAATEAASAPAVPARENAPAAAAQVMRARVDEFVQALRERNSERVAALFQAESPQDRRNLQALLERLRRPEARFKASDAQLGAADVREMEATADFQVPMSWTTPFGRVRNQTATFRAVLEPGDGGWRLVAIRAVGKLD